jgi:hypothetical protein
MFAAYESISMVHYANTKQQIATGHSSISHTKETLFQIPCTLQTNRLNFDEEVVGNPKQAKGHRNCRSSRNASISIVSKSPVNGHQG